MKVKGLTETRRNESQRDSWKKNKDVISYSFITIFFTSQYLSYINQINTKSMRVNTSQYEPIRIDTNQYTLDQTYKMYKIYRIYRIYKIYRET